MRETDPTIGHCGQCIRHRSLFVPPSVLDGWQIPYTVVDQRAPEVVVTMPRTYHSGFSTGYTPAEASNYADSGVDPPLATLHALTLVRISQSTGRSWLSSDLTRCSREESLITTTTPKRMSRMRTRR